MDYSKLSNEELLALKNKDYSKLSNETLVALKKQNAPESLGTKTNRVVANVAGGAMDLLNLPFEVAGEAAQKIVEPGASYEPPSFLQDIRLADKTAEPPMNPFTLTNKLVRAGTAGAGNLPKGLKAAGEAAQGAYSADPGVTGAVADAALAALTGKMAPQVMNAPMEAAGNALKMIPGAAKATAKVALRTLGPSGKAIAEKFARPEAIKDAEQVGTAQIAEEVAQGYAKVEQKIKGIEEEVSKVLRASPYLMEGAKPKEDILKIVANARKDIGMNIGPKQKFTKGVLDEISGNLKKLRNTVSEVQLRDIVQKVRDAVKFGKKEYGETDLALMRVAAKADKMLKTNLDYKALMKEEVPLQRLKTGLVDKFGLQRSVGEGFVATENTATKLKTILGEGKEIQSHKILNNLKKETGIDYIQKVKDNKVAKEFAPDKDVARGSSRTIIGSVAGMMLEPVIPGPQGSTTLIMGGIGRLADLYGPETAGRIIETLVKSGSKVGQLLNNPAIQGKTSAVQNLIREAARTQPILRPMMQQ